MSTRSLTPVLIAALLAFVPDQAIGQAGDGLAYARGSAIVAEQTIPKYREEFAKRCPSGGTQLLVDLESFRGDPDALTAFTASAVSDPWNRALGPLMTALADGCGDAAGRAAVNAKLRIVEVVHRRGLATPELSFADGVFRIVVDVAAKAPPSFQSVSTALTAGLGG